MSVRLVLSVPEVLSVSYPSQLPNAGSETHQKFSEKDRNFKQFLFSNLVLFVFHFEKTGTTTSLLICRNVGRFKCRDSLQSLVFG